MRDVKFIVGLLLLAGCSLVTLACYLQSHGAGIAMGILFAIVIISFFYDHGRDIFGRKAADHPDLERIRDAAIKHTRMTAMVEDGDLLTKH